jgi:hypothetical protein
MRAQALLGSFDEHGFARIGREHQGDSDLHPVGDAVAVLELQTKLWIPGTAVVLVHDDR